MVNYFKFFIIYIGLFCLNFNPAHAKSDKKSRKMAQAQSVIVFFDINEAHEEFRALQESNPGREIVRIPSLSHLSKPQLMNLILRRNNAEGVRFWSCRTVDDRLCRNAVAESNKLNQQLSAEGWNLNDEINHQLKAISANVSTVYVSGHYNLGKDDSGSILGKWGMVELSQISQIIDKKSSFQSVKHVGILSCYFGQSGFLQTYFPVALKRSLAIVGYKGTGPLTSDPMAAKFIQMFSKIDQDIVQKSFSFTTLNSQRSEILKLAKSVTSNRRVSVVLTNGQGGFVEVSGSPTQVTNQKIAKACAPSLEGLNDFFIRVQKSSLDITNGKGDRAEDDLIYSANSLVNDLKQHLKTTSSDCIFQQAREKSLLNEINQLLQLSDFKISSLDHQSYVFRNESKKSVINAITNQKIPLFVINQKFLELKKELVEEFSRLLLKNPNYNDLREIVSDLMALHYYQEYLGFIETTTNKNIHPDVVISDKLLELKSRFHYANVNSRLDYLQKLLDQVYNSEVKMDTFKEFGDRTYLIKYNIENEISFLKSIEK